MWLIVPFIVLISSCSCSIEITDCKETLPIECLNTSRIDHLECLYVLQLKAGCATSMIQHLFSEWIYKSRASQNCYTCLRNINSKSLILGRRWRNVLIISNGRWSYYSLDEILLLRRINSQHPATTHSPLIPFQNAIKFITVMPYISCVQNARCFG